MGKAAFGSPDGLSQCDGHLVPELPSAVPESTPPRRSNYLTCLHEASADVVSPKALQESRHYKKIQCDIPI